MTITVVPMKNLLSKNLFPGLKLTKFWVNFFTKIESNKLHLDSRYASSALPYNIHIHFLSHFLK